MMFFVIDIVANKEVDVTWIKNARRATEITSESCCVTADLRCLSVEIQGQQELKSTTKEETEKYGEERGWKTCKLEATANFSKRRLVGRH